MADTKVTALTENTAPLATDIAYMVTDPGGTPTSQKVTFANIRSNSVLGTPGAVAFYGSSSAATENIGNFSFNNTTDVLSVGAGLVVGGSTARVTFGSDGKYIDGSSSGIINFQGVGNTVNRNIVFLLNDSNPTLKMGCGAFTILNDTGGFPLLVVRQDTATGSSVSAMQICHTLLGANTAATSHGVILDFVMSNTLGNPAVSYRINPNWVHADSTNAQVLEVIAVNNALTTKWTKLYNGYYFFNGATVPTASIDIGACSATSSQFRLRGGAATTAPNRGDIFHEIPRGTLGAQFHGDGTAGTLHRLSSVLFTSTAVQIASNTIVQTSVIGSGIGSLTITSGNGFQVGKTYRLQASGILSATGVVTLNMIATIGGVAMGSTGNITVSGTVANNFWDVEMKMLCLSTGAIGSFFSGGKFYYDNAAAAGLSEGMVVTNSMALNTNTSQTIDLQAVWGTAAAGNTISGRIVSLEVLN